MNDSLIVTFEVEQSKSGNIFVGGGFSITDPFASIKISGNKEEPS